MHDAARRFYRAPALVIGALAVALLSGCTGQPSKSVHTPDRGGVSAAPHGQLPGALRQKLSDALNAVMATYHVPGAAVGVWLPGAGSWTAARGTADVAGKVPVSTTMSWPIRSITKSFTVTLLLQLADSGKLRLDDPLSKYVSGVTNGNEITLRELANMSSGNADYTSSAFADYLGENPGKQFTLAELNSFVLGRPAQFEPGTRRVYTNADTNLLGAVIEKVTGEPFADVLRDKILGPLHLKNTAYILDVKQWATMHPVGYINQLSGPEAQQQNMSIFGPAGSMVTTLDDARAWGQALADGTLLKPETQAQRKVGAPLDQGPPYDLYAMGMGETNGWWGHNGEGLGFTAAVFHQPVTGATIAVFMNASNVPGRMHPADQTFRNLASIISVEEKK